MPSLIMPSYFTFIQFLDTLEKDGVLLSNIPVATKGRRQISYKTYK